MVPDRGIRSRWGVVIAVVGWLTFYGLPVLAQAPDPSRATRESPPVESQGDGQTADGQQPADAFVLPVRIIEDPNEAERARDREQRAENHEADDLEAQREAARAATRSADAAEDQIWPTKAQVGLATVGTFLLFVSLGLTWAALTVTRQTAKRQLRAYVGISKGQVGLVAADNPITGIIMCANAGQTPAHECRVWYNVDVLENGKPLQLTEARAKSNGVSIHLPGMQSKHPIHTLNVILPEDLLLLQNDAATIIIYGEITYKDIFREKHTTRFRMQSGSYLNGTFTDLAFCDEGNDAD